LAPPEIKELTGERGRVSGEQIGGKIGGEERIG